MPVLFSRSISVLIAATIFGAGTNALAAKKPQAIHKYGAYTREITSPNATWKGVSKGAGGGDAFENGGVDAGVDVRDPGASPSQSTVRESPKDAAGSSSSSFSSLHAVPGGESHQHAAGSSSNGQNLIKGGASESSLQGGASGTLLQGGASGTLLQGGASGTLLQGGASGTLLQGGASGTYLQGGTAVFLTGPSGVAQSGKFDKLQPATPAIQTGTSENLLQGGASESLLRGGASTVDAPMLKSQIWTDSLNTGLQKGKFGFGNARVAPLASTIDERRLTGGNQSILFKAFTEMNCVEFNQLAANYYTADVNYHALDVGYSLALPGFWGGRVKVYTDGKHVIAIEPKTLDTWVARAGTDLGVRSNWRKLIHMK